MPVAAKSVRIQTSCQYLFTLLGSTGSKVARRTLMKLTLDVATQLYFSWISSTWRLRLDFEERIFEHCKHENSSIEAFDLWAMIPWRFKLSFRPNDSGQSRHRKGLRWIVFSWFANERFWLKLLSHFGHLKESVFLSFIVRIFDSFESFVEELLSQSLSDE